MYYIKELCVKLVTCQKLYRDAERSAKYIKSINKQVSTACHVQEFILLYNANCYVLTSLYLADICICLCLSRDDVTGKHRTR